MSRKGMNWPQEAGGTMPKVLIVDDSPAQLYSLRRMVEMAGHQAVVALERRLEELAEERLKSFGGAGDISKEEVAQAGHAREDARSDN